MISTLPSQDDALLHNLLLFSRILHALGLEVNPGRMVEVQAALAHVSIGYKSDFYHTLRTFLGKTTTANPRNASSSHPSPRPMMKRRQSPSRRRRTTTKKSSNSPRAIASAKPCA